MTDTQHPPPEAATAPGRARYRLPLAPRTLLVAAVLVLAVLATLGVLPLARLLDVDPRHLQGAGFRPTVRILAIVALYAASQFLLIWLAMRLVHRRPFASLGFVGPVIRPLLVGTAAGAAIKVAEILLHVLAGRNATLGWSVPAEVPALTVAGHFLLWLLFLLTLNSVKEELVFRAYPIEQFNDRPRAALWVIVGVSLVFAAVHHVIEPFRLSAFLSRFVTALVFAYVYYRWRSIWLVSGFHNGANLPGFLLCGRWRTGGLFELDYDAAAPAVRMAGDVLVYLAALGVIHWVWRRGQARRSPSAGAREGAS